MGKYAYVPLCTLCHFVLGTSLLYRQQHIVSPSSEKYAHCKSLWIKASAECPTCKCKYRGSIIKAEMTVKDET